MKKYFVTGSKILKDTPIGSITIFAGRSGILRLLFGSADDTPTQDEVIINILEKATRQLSEYFLGKRTEFEIPLETSSLPPFHAQVLDACRCISYGSVATYGELAAQVGRPNAARAVGTALARNPIPIFIPCHRIIGADRKLHGFAAPNGLSTKTWLLRLEGHTFAAEKLV